MLVFCKIKKIFTQTVDLLFIKFIYIIIIKSNSKLCTFKNSKIFQMNVNTTTVYSRGELLDWVNELLDLHYTQVEDLCNGAAFCQILDVLYPGKVKLRNVNYNARTEPEMLANYKIIQAVFSKENIDRNLPVDELVKGKPKIALQMLQWFKPFFDQQWNRSEYDGQARRDETGCKNPGETKAKRPVSSTRRGAEVPKTVSKPRKSQTSFATTPYNQNTNRVNNNINNNTNTVVAQRNVSRTVKIGTTPSSSTLNQQIEKLKEKEIELKNDNKILLEERDFYYQKLQSVETLCQNKEGNEFAQKILEILYQTDEERGFVSPDQLDI